MRDGKENNISYFYLRLNVLNEIIVQVKMKIFAFFFNQQSLVDKVSRRQRPDMNMLFLNMKVRRTHLVSDSLDEV